MDRDDEAIALTLEQIAERAKEIRDGWTDAEGVPPSRQSASARRAWNPASA